MEKYKKHNSGFTLIELLITIVLIGILASFGLVTLTSAQKKARDTQRKNDLGQIKKALVAARSDCKGGYFPKSTDDPANADKGIKSYNDNLLPYLKGLGYLKTNLKDPKYDGTETSTYHYMYKTNKTNGAVVKTVDDVCPNTTGSTLSYSGSPHFFLKTRLENTKDPDIQKSITLCDDVISLDIDLTGEPNSTSDYYACSDYQP